MNSKDYLRKTIVISLVLYAVVVGILAFHIYRFEDGYASIENKYVKELKAKIQEALEGDDVKQQLAQVAKDNAVEIVVRNEKTVYFETIPLRLDAPLQTILNEKGKLVEAGEQLELDGEAYELWYCIYRVPLMEYLEEFLTKYNILTLLIFVLVILMIILFQHNLTKPLFNILNALEQWNNNEFTEEDVKRDVISQEVYSHFFRQSRALSEVSKKNTKLEWDLGLEKERLYNTIHLSKALVHDLKSPVHATLIENELLLEKRELPAGEQKIIRWNIKELDTLLRGINNVLRVLKEDTYQFEKRIERIDVVALTLKAINHLKPLLKKKQLAVSFEGPDALVIAQNKVGVQLLLHNILSNLASYSVDGSEARIDLSQEDAKVILVTSNQSNEADRRRLIRSERIENVVEDSLANSGGQEYSSGNGIYLITDMVELLGGDYSYEIHDCEVSSRLVLYSREDKEDEEEGK